jgi:hypothetical protein
MIRVLAEIPRVRPYLTRDAVLDVALEALRFAHAHAEVSRSRAAGLLTACGLLWCRMMVVHSNWCR